MDGFVFEALLKHPRPMGRPFMYRWITIHARDIAAAKAAAATEARLCGWRVSKVRRQPDIGSKS
jgi:hypothetical protein